MKPELKERFEAGEILTGELPPTPRRPPDYVQRTTQRRPDCQLKACCQRSQWKARRH